MEVTHEYLAANLGKQLKGMRNCGQQAVQVVTGVPFALQMIWVNIKELQ